MSGDTSSEQWSFENLTQSSDSGFPLLSNIDGVKSPNPPLSLVLNDRATRGSGIPLRSPSNGSTRGPHLLRRPVGCGGGPESVASDTLSSNHTSQQRLLYSPASRNSMAGPSAAERAGRVSDSSPAHVAIPGGTPRSSVYSDRAVFAMSRSPGRSLRPYGSASPPPTTPAAAYARPSDDSRRAYRSPHPNTRMQGPSSAYMWQPSQQQQQHQQQQQQQSSAGLRGGGGVGVPKTYGLPVTSDIAQQASSEQWRRVRVERDYSQGDMRQFVVVVPDQLVGRIDEQRFRRFIRRLNTMMAEAEGATLRNVLEGCLAYATLYLSTLLVKSKFKKTVERISQFVAHENKTFFEPAGLLVIDPLQTAYMFIEIANI